MCWATPIWRFEGQTSQTLTTPCIVSSVFRQLSITCIFCQHVEHTLLHSGDRPQLRKTSLEVLSWAEEEGGSHVLGGSANRVNATHPIFTLTTEALMSHFYRQAISRSK
ncbi:hypothetical protein EDD17DRAFT_536351 [Pisolithus thermaeus]|nr:hypothetical protein EV401DRAFT_765387 [Pisolithus croceorrhizus]KAI6162645.1 hypothetical protein EDD17DRAFT_536351 [Pisolithus thermaeus]